MRLIALNRTTRLNIQRATRLFMQRPMHWRTSSMVDVAFYSIPVASPTTQILQLEKLVQN